MKDCRMRLRELVLLVVVSGMLAACHRDDAGLPPAAGAASDGQTQEQFQQDLQGIWSTTHRRGDDAETLYSVEWLDGAGLRVVRDGAWLDGRVEDIDLANGTLALHVTSPSGPSETVTLRKVPDTASPDAFFLRITWGAGQSDELGFVRRLTARDREEIAAAIRAAALKDVDVTCDTQAPAGSLRATLVCGREDFAALDADMRAKFTELAARYPDGERTVLAATRQLDACATPACLRDAYAQWQAYFEENYDLGDILDY